MGVDFMDDQERKRIEARRARDNERTKKLYNARLRNIGADIAGIQNQIETKKKVKEQEKQAELEYAKQQEEIRQYVTRIEAEEYEAKHAEAQRLRRQWMDQSMKRPERREADIALGVLETPIINAENCGVSAAQKFDGEDELQQERHRLQALQLKNWSDDLIKEKQKKKQEVEQEEREYAEFIKNVAEYQDKQEENAEKSRALYNYHVLQQNKRLVDEKKSRLEREKHLQSKKEEAELMSSAGSSLLTESRDQAVSVIKGRVRTDHWKGMEKDQVKSIIYSNEEIMAEKEANRKKEREENNKYAETQDMIRRCMEQQEYEEFQRQQQQNLMLKRTLDQQVQENKLREEKQKDLSRGKIERGFFENFGKSYR